MPYVFVAERSVLQNVQSVSLNLAVSILTVCVCVCVCVCVGFMWQDISTDSLCVCPVQAAGYFDWKFVFV